MGFQGLMSEDFIQDANYSVLKEAVHCGVTMTCNTGDSNMEAVTAKWNYWTTELSQQRCSHDAGSEKCYDVAELCACKFQRNGWIE